MSLFDEQGCKVEAKHHAPMLRVVLNPKRVSASSDLAGSAFPGNMPTEPGSLLFVVPDVLLRGDDTAIPYFTYK